MRPTLTRLLLACGLLFIIPLTANAQNLDLFGGSQSLKGQLDSSPEFLPVEQAYQLNVEANQKSILLTWDIQPGYYLYSERFAFSDSEQPLTFTNLSKSQIKFDDYFDREVEVFYDLVEIEINIEDRSDAPFTLKVSSQGCADAGLCYPPQSQYFQIDPNSNSAEEVPAPSRKLAPAEPSEESSLWLILLLAAAGGSLLNLMPCVFPVLSIKALSLAKSGGNNLVAHGWTYTAGAVLTFIAIAALMIFVRAGGEAVGWGFQLQSPLLIALLAYLFFAMGLSLSGLASFGSRLMGVGQNLTAERGLRGSFFTGALATLVASPCTAPFMATALGYALTQPPATALLVFAALGFGMALPFLLLCYSPKLAQKLPQPGQWMETLKQFLAFPLYLSAVWLLWVLGRQAGSDAIALASIGLLLIAFALWVTHLREKTRLGAQLRTGIAIACIASALMISTKLDDKIENENMWQDFSSEKLQSLRSSGQAVFINLTADWCLTCLANEKLTLDRPELEELFKLNNITALKGDWTNYNAEITSLLEQYQRSGVPLYLYFPAQAERATVLPQLLRHQHIEEAIASSQR